jgi:hypothetical protein
MEWIRQYPDSPWYGAVAGGTPAAARRIVTLTYGGRGVQTV